MPNGRSNIAPDFQPGQFFDKAIAGGDLPSAIYDL